MTYLAIDIETTGLQRDICQILEVAAIVDTGGEIETLPTFQCYCKYDIIVGQPKALAMHQAMFNRWCDTPHLCTFVQPNELLSTLYTWMQQYPGAIIAGRNFDQFDKPFLNAHADRYSVPRIPWPDAVVDPAIHFKRLGERVPSLKKALDYAGIPEECPHTAVGDCRAVLRLLRKLK